jgi:hypothetical protein
LSKIARVAGGCGRAGRRHRQGELELAVLGDADVLAHQPVGFGESLKLPEALAGGVMRTSNTASSLKPY